MCVAGRSLGGEKSKDKFHWNNWKVHRLKSNLISLDESSHRSVKCPPVTSHGLRLHEGQGCYSNQIGESKLAALDGPSQSIGRLQDKEPFHETRLARNQGTPVLLSPHNLTIFVTRQL